jgi:hypothetical protein
VSLTRSIFIFLGALIFSTLLWAYVRLSAATETDIDLPVSITPPKGLAVSSPVPERIHTRVRGAGWQILLLGFTHNGRFQFDLGDRSVTENTPVVIRGDEIMHAAMAPSEVRPIKVDPDSLTITFAKRVEKRVPIAPLTDITPGPGYVMVGKPIASPATVVIYGAQNILDSIAVFPTTLVMSHGVKQDIEQTILLSDSLDNYVDVVHEAPITVHADIQAIGERKIQGLVAGVDALPPSFDVLLIPSSVSVTMRGGVDLLAALKPRELRVHIPFDPVIFDSARSLVPIVELPEGVQLLSVDPPRIKFIIRRRPGVNANR